MENNLYGRVFCLVSKHFQKDQLTERNIWGKIHTFLSSLPRVPPCKRTAISAAIAAPMNSWAPTALRHFKEGKKTALLSLPGLGISFILVNRRQRKKPTPSLSAVWYKWSPGFTWQWYQRLHLIRVIWVLKDQTSEHNLSSTTDLFTWESCGFKHSFKSHFPSRRASYC